MQSNLVKNIARIFLAFSEVDKSAKTAIKYGFKIFALVFFIGTALLIYNRVMFGFDFYFEFISTSVIKSSFTILAEVIIGSLLIDYIFKRN